MKINLLIALMLGFGLMGCASFNYEFQKTAYYSHRTSGYQTIFYDGAYEDILSVSVAGNMAYVLVRRTYPVGIAYDLKTYKIRKNKQIIFQREYDEFGKPTIFYDEWRKAEYP